LLISLLIYFPCLVLAGKSTATAEEVEAKQKELEKQLTELKENEEERNKVDVQNNEDGNNNSPNEADSAEELSQWDELIKHGKQSIVEIVNWFSR